MQYEAYVKLRQKFKNRIIASGIAAQEFNQDLSRKQKRKLYKIIRRGNRAKDILVLGQVGGMIK